METTAHRTPSKQPDAVTSHEAQAINKAEQQASSPTRVEGPSIPISSSETPPKPVKGPEDPAHQTATVVTNEAEQHAPRPNQTDQASDQQSSMQINTKASPEAVNLTAQSNTADANRKSVSATDGHRESDQQAGSNEKSATQRGEGNEVDRRAVAGLETVTVELTGQERSRGATDSQEKSADETGQKDNLAEKNGSSVAVPKQPEQETTKQVKQEPNSTTAEETGKVATQDDDAACCSCCLPRSAPGTPR